jgi:hypothetical protein
MPKLTRDKICDLAEMLRSLQAQTRETLSAIENLLDATVTVSDWELAQYSAGLAIRPVDASYSELVNFARELAQHIEEQERTRQRHQ